MIEKVWGFSGVRFVFVGVINTLVDFTILNILVFVFDLNNILANTISVSIAMFVSYILNNIVVFRYQGKNHARNILLFIAITAFGLFILQNLVIYLLVHIIQFPADLVISVLQALGFENYSQEFIALNFAKAVATGVTMIWNYFMYKKYVFNDKATTNKKTPDNQTS